MLVTSLLDKKVEIAGPLSPDRHLLLHQTGVVVAVLEVSGQLNVYIALDKDHTIVLVEATRLKLN